MKTRFFAKHFREAHPENMACSTDMAYALAANKLAHFLDLHIKESQFDQLYWPGAFRRVILHLTLYLEDQKSNLAIWQSFLSLYRKTYKKAMPFYDIRADEERPLYNSIHPQAITFVIWNALSSDEQSSNVVYSPLFPLTRKIADCIYGGLMVEYTQVPPNDDLWDRIYGDTDFEDFQAVKSLLFWLTERCYLTTHFLTDRKIDDEVDTLEKQTQHDEVLTYMAFSHVAVTQRIGPLALPAPLWLATMLQHADIGDVSEATLKQWTTALEQMEGRPLQQYNILERNDEYIKLKDADDQIFQLPLNSFYKAPDTQFSPHATATIGMAHFNGQWVCNGIAGFRDNATVANNFAIYCKQKKVMQEDQELIRQKIAELGNKRLFFFRSMSELTDWERQTFGTATQKEPLSRYSRNNNDQCGILCFYCKDGKVLFTDDAMLIRCIAMPENAHYDEELARLDSHLVALDPFWDHIEPIRYLLDEGLLPGAALEKTANWEEGHEQFMANTDFLLRYFHRHNYTDQ